MRKDKSLWKKAERLNVTSERLQGKGHVSVASFSGSFLRGNRKDYSASCHRLDTPKIPALLCQALAMRIHTATHAGCSFPGASRNPSLVSSCSPGQVSHVTGARTIPGTMPAASSGAPQPGWYFADLSGVGPAARGASWSLQISPLASCINVSLLLSWVVSPLCYHKGTQRWVLWTGKLKAANPS